VLQIGSTIDHHSYCLLPFYESHPNETSRPDPNLVNRILDGTEAWQSIPSHRLPPTLTHLANPFVAETNRRIRTHICRRRRDNGRQYCSCDYFTGTGKRCAGLWAFSVVELVGQLTECERDFEANQVEGNKVDLTDQPGLAHERVGGQYFAGASTRQSTRPFGAFGSLHNKKMSKFKEYRAIGNLHQRAAYDRRLKMQRSVSWSPFKALGVSYIHSHKYS